MGLSPEIVMLLMYAIALMMILLGVAIDSRRVNRKLDNILALLTTSEHDKHNIGYGNNERQDIFPNQSNFATPENSNRYKAKKQDKNHIYSRAFAHIKSIANIITGKQPNANKTIQNLTLRMQHKGL